MMGCFPAGARGTQSTKDLECTFLYTIWLSKLFNLGKLNIMTEIPR